MLPFNMFPEVDPVLGPEMRSTGEVLGMAPTFGLAYFKAQEAAGSPLPLEGHGLHLRDRQGQAGRSSRRRASSRSSASASRPPTAPASSCRQNGVHVRTQLQDSRAPAARTSPTRSRARQIHLIINTPRGKTSAADDAYIRKAAIKYKVPYVTTTAAAKAAVVGIAAARAGKAGVKSLRATTRTSAADSRIPGFVPTR